MSKMKPIIPQSHRNEWKSKDKFQELIEPWYLPSGWTGKDYGIDGQIEIATTIKNSTDAEAEGLFFLVQLKCLPAKGNKRRYSFSVPVKKIAQWYRSNLPVLLVLFDVEENSFYYLWINEDLVNTLDVTKPGWVTKKSVSVKINPKQIICTETLKAIRAYVADWRRPSKKIIEPGLYFELSDKCERLTHLVANEASGVQFDSIDKMVTAAMERIKFAIYSIAIAGPSRTGKSKTINALLHKDNVSPVGIYQTTGVPLQILPGVEEKVVIAFSDGRTEQYEFSREIIEKYVSQDYNIDNEKKVLQVSIFTRNIKLEKGISLFDIPGLDDPEEGILDNARRILGKANAILYFIDASIAEHGGYAFRNEYKRDIIDFSTSMDKIFLVFNKIDTVSPDKLAALKTRVESDLRRLQLFDKIGGKVHYISAEESLKNRLSRRPKEDSLGILENEIWQYLLRENKIGIRRLLQALEFNREIVRNFTMLAQTKIANITKKRQILAALEDINKKMPDLTKVFHTEYHSAQQRLTLHIENQKNRILDSLRKRLQCISVEDELPGKNEIKGFLQTSMKSAIESTDKLFEESAHSLGLAMKMWTEGIFKQIWEIISDGQPRREFASDELESIEVPPIDVSQALGVGFMALILGVLISPAYAVYAAFSSLFANLALTMPERRAKRIEKLMRDVTAKSDDLYARLTAVYAEAFHNLSEEIRTRINNNIQLYYKDLYDQVREIDVPVSKEEEVKYQECCDALDRIQGQIVELKDELLSWVE